MTRIVAGRYGGRRLAVPAGRGTRPTSDRVREALFGALGPLDGLAFLDLYAGSGAIGLEAASRGAVPVLLVESDGRAAGVLRSNIDSLGAGPVVRLVSAPVERVLRRGPASPASPASSGGPAFDVVYADPPYALTEPQLTAVLSDLVEWGWLAPDGRLVIERSSRSPEPSWVPGVTPTRTRRYGETTLWYGAAS